MAWNPPLNEHRWSCCGQGNAFSLVQRRQGYHSSMAQPDAALIVLQSDDVMQRTRVYFSGTEFSGTESLFRSQCWQVCLLSMTLLVCLMCRCSIESFDAAWSAFPGSPSGSMGRPGGPTNGKICDQHPHFELCRNLHYGTSERGSVQ